MSSNNSSPTMASQNSHSFHWQYAEFEDSDFQIRGRTLFFIVVLFAIILTATLLFLYARWVCKFRSPSSAEAARSAHALPIPPAPQGLDSAFIDNLPIILHTTSLGSTTGPGREVECCICLGIFQDGDKNHTRNPKDKREGNRQKIAHISRFIYERASYLSLADQLQSPQLSSGQSRGTRPVIFWSGIVPVSPPSSGFKKIDKDETLSLLKDKRSSPVVTKWTLT
ncbi:hypothetical protein HAX54_044224 [Datura stramonium]|uniref:Uncharacterized protein n=1 Tax=Datura stramonium TaxID=4076 RepID=A0ABS8SPF8_DATST|nr:hypothetical protein [Datura stramonium]